MWMYKTSSLWMQLSMLSWHRSKAVASDFLNEPRNAVFNGTSLRAWSFHSRVSSVINMDKIFRCFFFLLFLSVSINLWYCSVEREKISGDALLNLTWRDFFPLLFPLHVCCCWVCEDYFLNASKDNKDIPSQAKYKLLQFWAVTFVHLNI